MTPINPFLKTSIKDAIIQPEKASELEEGSLLESLLKDIDEEDKANVANLSGETELTDNDVNFYIRKVKETKEEIANAEDTAKKYMENRQDQVNAWLEKETKSKRNYCEFVENILETYTKKRLEGSKKKSINFIEGTLKLVHPAPEYVRDDDKIRESIIINAPQYLEVLPAKVKWSELKKAGTIDTEGNFLLDGKIVEGISVKEKPVTFSIK